MSKRPIDVYVNTPDSEDDDEAGGAIARVTAVATGEVSTVRIPTRDHRRSPMRVGLELDPGTYTIEARLPSGSLERQQVEVRADRDVPPVVFAAQIELGH